MMILETPFEVNMKVNNVLIQMMILIGVWMRLKKMYEKIKTEQRMLVK